MIGGYFIDMFIKISNSTRQFDPFTWSRGDVFIEYLFRRSAVYRDCGLGCILELASISLEPLVQCRPEV